MSDYEVRLTRKAEAEFRKGVDWYEQELEGLGLRFAEQVRKRLVKVGNNPLFYPPKDFDSRQTNVIDFPYLIVYRIYPKLKLIVVISVFHTKRHPRKKI